MSRLQGRVFRRYGQQWAWISEWSGHGHGRGRNAVKVCVIVGKGMADTWDWDGLRSRWVLQVIRDWPVNRRKAWVLCSGDMARKL